MNAVALGGLAVCVGLWVGFRAFAQESGGGAPNAEGPRLVLTVAAMVFAAFFRASEAIILPARRNGDSARGGDSARSGDPANSSGDGKAAADELLRSLARRHGPVLNSILVGNITSLVVYALAAPALIASAVHAQASLPAEAITGIAFIASAIVYVVFCDTIPRLIAFSYPRSVSRVVAYPLAGVVWALNPIAVGLVGLTDLLFQVSGVGRVKAAIYTTDKEIKSALNADEVRDVLEAEEGQMIEGILEFSDALLREILVPRPDIVALKEDSTVREALDLYREQEYSRMPAFAEDLDHITGLLVAKDLLPCVVKREWDRPISEIMRPPRFVPETMTALAFVRDAQRMQIHLAIVVDEYGGTAGIVTLEDAIEQVVGEIHDQSDERREQITTIGDGVYRIDGSLPLHELSTLLGVPIDDDEHETVGGFLMNQIHKIPEQGDQSEHLGARFTVDEVDGKRVTRLTVQVLPPMVKEQAG